MFEVTAFRRALVAYWYDALLRMRDIGSRSLHARHHNYGRYGTGSTLITSQLPVTAWHDVIGEPTFADAILDRLVHNAYRLELEGQSFRKQGTKMGDETSTE